MNNLIISLTLIGLQILSAAPTLESLSDLKALQERVQNVVVAATPATVSLISLRNGSAGSGVTVSAGGLVLTAAHVVQGSREMIVVFPDGREERARVLGANSTRDAAMVQLIGDGPWAFVEVGESDLLVTGDFVVAMGHPKGIRSDAAASSPLWSGNDERSKRFYHDRLYCDRGRQAVGLFLIWKAGLWGFIRTSMLKKRRSTDMQELRDLKSRGTRCWLGKSGVF